MSGNKDFLKELALVCFPALISSLPELIRAIRNQPESSMDKEDPKEEEDSQPASLRSFVLRSSAGR